VVDDDDERSREEQPADVLLIDTTDRIRTLTLNRPKVRNALSTELRDKLFPALRSADVDPDVDVVILTGTDPAFCAGIDLKEIGTGINSSAGIPDLSPAWPSMTTPVIGAINGVTVTGGFELALCCDILIASENARFADTHARVGIMPGWGLSQKLSRIIGPSRAKELSLTGNFLDAATAERWGLVNRVFAPDDLLPAAKKLAHEMAQVDGALLKKLKALADDGAALPLKEALAMEIQRGHAHNRAVTPAEAEANRGKVMERGREQKS
jgi:enoyl-CoA hydratase